MWIQSFKVRKCGPLSPSTFRIPWFLIYFHKNSQLPPLGLVWTTPSNLQHSNQTTKTNPSIFQFKCSYRKNKKLGGTLPSSTFIATWRKKHKSLLTFCIHCCKLKDNGVALQGRLLQDNNNEGDCVLPSPKYWLVLYLQEKKEEGGCDAPPLIFFEANDNMGGTMCSRQLATWKKQNTWRLVAPLLQPLRDEDK